jgi:hypothetical protein
MEFSVAYGALSRFGIPRSLVGLPFEYLTVITITHGRCAFDRKMIFKYVKLPLTLCPYYTAFLDPRRLVCRRREAICPYGV